MNTTKPDSFDPYTKWLGIPDGQRPPDYYVLLDVHPNESDPTVIRRAADERTKVVRPRCLKNRELGTRLLNEIAKARVCLTDPNRRAAYDESLNQESLVVKKAATSTPLTLAFRRKRELRGHTLPVACVDFDPQGLLLASAAHDGTAKIWNPSSGQLLATLGDSTDGTRGWILDELGNRAPLTQAAFSPDGAFFVTGGQATTTKLWDVTKRELWQRLEHDSQRGANNNVVTSLAFQPNSPILAVGSSRQPVEIWNVDEGKLVRRVACPTKDLAFSPDGRMLVTSQGVWDFDANEPVSRFGRDGSAVNCLKFSGDGALLVAGTRAGLHYWETANGMRRTTLGCEKRSVSSAAFSPDGLVLVAGLSDGKLEVWDVSESSLLFQLKAHEGRVESIAFSPDATVLATGGGNDNAVRLWEVFSDKELLDMYADFF